MHSVVWKSALKFPVMKLTQQFNKISLFPSLCHVNVRDIQEQSHGESGSLMTRFMKYIALENCKVDPLIKTKIKYSQLYPMHNLMDFSRTLNKIEVDQLPKLVIYTYTFKTNGDPLKVVQVINEIDNICCKSLLKMSNSEILRTLYSFMYLIPNKITKLNFYDESMECLVENFDTKQGKHDFVQICYYLGLSKKNKKNAKLLKEFLDMFLKHYLKDLNTMDLAIVSNATFKASLPYPNEEFQECVKNETLNLSNSCTDDSVLITFIKFLRLNHIKSDEIYEKLGALIQNQSAVANFHFKGLVHIFAYFADGLWNDKNVCSTIIGECMQRLKDVGFENNLFNDMRPKDLATFFWSCANLGTQLDSNDLTFIEKLLLNKYNKNEFDYCGDEFIDMVLSLWMLGLKSQRLIMPIQKQFVDVKSKKPYSERIKLNSRLDLLLNCVALEFPDWMEKTVSEKIFDEDRKCPEFLLKNNPDTLNMMKCLNENLDEFKISNLKLVLPIKDINIPSIHLEFENGNKYFLEILNKVLKFNMQQPTAIVSLKIKLLEGLGCKVIIINAQDSESPVDILKSKILQLSEMKKINEVVL